jgi:diguanylate cyclase (GGDEF)-like protein
VAVLVVGLTASIWGAGAWNGSQVRRAHGNFAAAADATGNAVRSSLQRYGDLLRGVGAFLQQRPVTHQSFDQYLTRIGYFAGQFPGVLGLGEIEQVPQGQLAAFVAAARADGLGGYTVSPAGSRPRYCLASQVATSGLSSPLPLLGYDFCTVDFMAHAFDSATVTAEQAVVPGSFIGALYANDFVLVVPLYDGVSVPASAEARRTANGAWSVAIVSSAEMRKAVLAAGSGGVAFSLLAGSTTDRRYRVMSSSPAPASAGGALTRVTHFVAHGDWTLETVPMAGAFNPTTSGPILLWVVGCVASLLLAALIWLLASSRSRALTMVRQRTLQLQRQALHDNLTGLPNRALIMDRAAQMLTRAQRNGTNVGTLFIDLDNFKNVNDSFGHAVGDDLLCAVARRLSDAVRAAETVGRLGGDEFVVLVEEPTGGESPARVAERLLALFDEPFRLDGHPDLVFDVEASIGVALGPRAGAGDLLRDADVALYRAKALGKNRSVVFRSEMQVAARRRQALDADLRKALERGELFLAYQPVLDLQDGSVCGVEALVRWQHPTKGVVPPDVFIPTAEETGVIGAIGRFVLDEACSQAAAWHRMGLPVAVAVNVSGRQLDDPGLVHDVTGALALSGLPPHFLTLEMTESVVMHDIDATTESLTRLKALGVQIAVDDFGSGYSSLAYLQKFPVDVLKIDRAFVSDIADSEESRALIRTFVQLGRTLHLETLAEGIEDDRQLAVLREEMCDRGQGYLFAPPLEPADVAAYVRTHHLRAPEPGVRGVVGTSLAS